MRAQSLVGGDALHCHRAGSLEYRMLRFERGTTSRGAERRDPAVGRIAARRRRND
jgi:hypothetical protein